MRQHDRLTASLLLVLAIIGGCRSFEAHQTTATGVSQSSPLGLEDTTDAADPAAPRFARRGRENPLGWIRQLGHRTERETSPSISLVGVIAEIPSSSAWPELTGTFDTAESVNAPETFQPIEAPGPTEASAPIETFDPAEEPDPIQSLGPIESLARTETSGATETLDPIDLPPVPESGPAIGWGHTTAVESGLIPCPECQSSGPSWLNGGGPSGAADWTSLPPLCAEEWAALSNHLIRVGDELEVKFPHRPLFSEKVMVREDGMISLPLIEPVMAAGLTPEQLQATLSERYRALQYDPSIAREGRVEKKYLLSVGDKLEIRFDTERPDPQLAGLADSVTIRPDGKISLPLIGTVTAEGRTPEELEAELTALYRKYYKEADPVLIVREFTNNRVLIDGEMKRTGLKNIDDVVVLARKFDRLVFVAGEVTRPGFVKLAGPMTVTQAIIAAGGPKRSAQLRTVAMFHEGPCNRAEGRLLNLNCQWTYESQKRIPADRRGAIHDVPLSANDVIIVPKTMISKVSDTLDQYVYQLIPMTKNTSFQYVYTTGSAVGLFGF